MRSPARCRLPRCPTRLRKRVIWREKMGASLLFQGTFGARFSIIAFPLMQRYNKLSSLLRSGGGCLRCRLSATPLHLPCNVDARALHSDCKTNRGVRHASLSAVTHDDFFRLRNWNGHSDGKRHGPAWFAVPEKRGSSRRNEAIQNRI